MEAKGGGGGEVRRLHIIYFLSHMGRVDHPHLIRVHHLTRTGVYLRDVKRWLTDLRGKETAEAYAWSYKRRYKTGYVWQDLLDDDLITPISDNEYVLKGSEIISATFDASSNIQYVVGNKAASGHKEQQQPPTELVEHHHKIDQSPTLLEQDFKTFPDSKTETPTTKITSEINQESPHFGSERSTLTDIESDESMRMDDHSSSSFYSKKNMKAAGKKDHMQVTPASSHSSSSPSSSSSSSTTTTPTKSTFNKSKSYSSGASYLFRNLMSCGAVDTNDAVLVMLNNRRGDKSDATKHRTSKDNGILKGDTLGGSARVFGTFSSNNQQHQKHSASSSRKSTEREKDNSKKQQQSKKQREFTNQNQKAVSAAYRPVREPNCSQCGKPFKPEKMHSHMKSCKGIKALAKTAVPASLNKTPPHSNFNDSASGYLLTN